MPSPCKICTNPQRKRIEQALVTGATRTVARTYRVSEDSLQRHKQRCLPRLVSQAASRVADELAQGQSILDQLQAITDQALAIAERAEKANDPRTQLLAIRELRANLELTAKLTGQLQFKAEHNSLHIHLDPNQARQVASVYLARHGGIVETPSLALAGGPQVADSVDTISAAIADPAVADSTDFTMPEETHEEEF